MQLIYRTVLGGRALRGIFGLSLALTAVSTVLPVPTLRAADEFVAAPGRQVPLPYSFRDDFGTQWDVQANGVIGPGNADIFDAGGNLFVGPNDQYSANAPTAEFDPARNELSLPPQPMAGLNVSRRISVDPRTGWCRWIEILENPTAAAVKTQVHLNFNLGSPVQSSQNVVDPKTHQSIGLAVFDGNRGIAMLSAGRGANVGPAFVAQQGQSQVDITWDIEVPARKTVAIAHLQAVRPNVNDAVALLERSSDKQVLHDLPAALAKVVVNFPNHAISFGDLELLRGDLLDVIELRGGDQYKGAIQEKTFSLQTNYGLVTLPVEKVLAMLAVGDFRPTQLFVTREGEAFGGALQSPIIHVKLSSGQVTPIPVNSIRRLGLRRQLNDPEEFKYDHPMLMLRNGDRIAVEMPAAPIAVYTRYGNLLLKPQAIGALVFQTEDQPMHQLLLADGSRIAALVAADALELRPLSTGAAKGISFPAAAVSRLQFSEKIDEPGDQSPLLSLSTGDRLAGALTGKIQIETAFDTIEIDGAEVRGLHHAGSSPNELQMTLWDDTSLSGRLKGDVIDMTLKSGPGLHIPAALIEEYTQPQPLPPASVMEKLRALVAELGSDDWNRADRAASEIWAMGPRITGALLSLRAGQAPPVQERIDAVLSKYRPKGQPPQAKPAGDGGGF